MTSSSNADPKAKVDADAKAKADADAKAKADAKAEADLVRMHPAFPRSPKPCKNVATAFFDCFNKNSEKEHDDDKGNDMHFYILCLNNLCSSSSSFLPLHHATPCLIPCSLLPIFLPTQRPV